MKYNLKITRNIFIIGFTSLYILYGCSGGSKNLDKLMVNVSEFKMDSTALKDGEHVWILGSSGNISKENKIDFYSLVVVKSLRTGDTVNVLLTNFFMADLNHPETQFISNSSTTGKIFDNILTNDGVINEDIKNVKDIKTKSFNKVFYDTNYINLDVRKYPAIIGNFGKISIKKK